MATVATDTRVTPEDLLLMPDGGRFELVDGELLEKEMGWNSSWVAAETHARLRNHCREHNLGLVNGAEAGYRCFPDDPNKVRKPDASFISFDRLPPYGEREGFARIAPDAAVEVVSPHDLYADVEIKVAEYLSAGVRLVWVLNPATKSVRVHRADGSVADLGPDDELSGEDVIRGFSCRVGDLFEMPPAAP